MAKMIPDIDPATITNEGERAVYSLLRDQLPESWVVRHHFPACWLNGRHLRECECDFIVLAPGRGLMLLEVKGSHGYHSENGQWFRVKRDGNRELTDNPFEQASATKHKLVERISNKVFHRNKYEFPGLFGHAVVYPFGRALGQLPTSTEPSLLFGYADMPRLREKLEAAFTSWGARDRGEQFTAAAMESVERFLSEGSDLVTVLAAQVDEDERRIEDLTRRQFTAFRGILGHPRVHVNGTAGSGKTLIALWAADALAAKGQKVLLLCFNRVLAAWLDSKSGRDPRVDVRSFFSLCREVVTSTGSPFVVPKDETEQRNFWCNTAPRLFCETLESHPTKVGGCDAVLVDEAQDFHPDWWFPVQLLLKDPDNGRLTIFSDPEQAGVYGHGGSFPANLLQYELLENCRNTKKIVLYCGNVIERDIVPFTASPDGVIPVIHSPLKEPEHRANAIQKVIAKLLNEGFQPSRIVILSPYRATTQQSAISKLFSVKGIPIRSDEKSLPLWSVGKAIWFSTIKSFKGLEADCVIIADVPVPGDATRFSLSDLYVAASRAKHRLWLFPESDSAAQLLTGWVSQPPQ